MKSIKLTSNAFKGKDYIVSVPVVVKPAVTRNLAYNLKEAMNTDPALGLVLSEEKFNNLTGSDVASQILDDLLNHEDANHNAAPLITVEDIFDPAEYLKDTTKYQKKDLADPEGLPEGLFTLTADGAAFENLIYPSDLLDIRPDIDDDGTLIPRLNIANEIVIPHYNGSSPTLKIPVVCQLVGRIPAGVTLTVETDKEGNITGPYSVSIDEAVAQEGAIFNIEVTISMGNAKVYADNNDVTGTAISNPKIKKWSATKVFKGSVSLLPLE